MSETKQRGQFCWNELLTSDLNAAKAFYSEALGWTLEEVPGCGGAPYLLIKQGNKELGGMMTIPSQVNTAPVWNSYIEVDDVDARVQHAEKLGATIVIPPTDLPDVGRIATLRDPQGTLISMVTHSK